MAHESRRSVEIRFRKWKCVFNQFHPWLGVVDDDDFHNIESKKNVGIIEHSQPGQRAARNSLLFFPIHCLEWTAEIFACPCFYFHKHQRVVVTTDNVDFATAAAAKIAQQDFVTAMLQESAR